MTDPVVVIGSGFGGLAAAVRLRAMGWPVLILEARDQPGGRAGVWRQDGFTFDAGPTVITAPYLLEELFSLLGADMKSHLDLVPVDPFYRIDFSDGTVFNYAAKQEALLDEIRRIHPPDVDGYLRLLRLMEQIFDVGYGKLSDVPFDRVSDMIRVIPQLVRLQSYKSVYQLVADHLQDERLRTVFTFQPLLVGGNPFQTTSIYTLIHWLERKWGVHFAKGGTTAIVAALVELLAKADVELRLNAPVEEIEAESGSVRAVRLTSGERIACRMVVSNADPSVVYREMLAPEHRRKHTDRAISRKRQSMSLFVAYFGARRTYPELAHHTIILGPRYRPLLDDIFNKKVLAEDFSLYLHAPTRTDKQLAPPGHENFYVLSPVPNQKSGIEWERTADFYLQRIYQELERRGLTDLRQHLVTQRVVDPRYFEKELRSQDGAAFGLEPVLTQSAWFRYHARSEDVDGLYFVGASTHPGAGLPGVLSGAKVLEKVVPRPSAAERHAPSKARAKAG